MDWSNLLHHKFHLEGIAVSSSDIKVSNIPEIIKGIEIIIPKLFFLIN